MNHLGDTNKIISETPISDSTPHNVADLGMQIRRIERKLNAAHVEIERLTAKVAQLYEGAEEQKQRIKRLEEALEGTVKWIVDLADSGDAGFWNSEEQPEIIVARAALKKEAKL